jgi:hypothetical protein
MAFHPFYTRLGFLDVLLTNVPNPDFFSILDNLHLQLFLARLPRVDNVTVTASTTALVFPNERRRFI